MFGLTCKRAHTGTKLPICSINYRSLPPLQRVLLSCDGTLGNVIEAFFLESVEAIRIAQKTSRALRPLPELDLAPSHLLMQRKVIIVGARTRRTYLYAESWIAMGKLPTNVRRDLEHSSKTIGQMWAENNMELRKELLHISKYRGYRLLRLFGNTGWLLNRKYRVISGSMPIMLISEYIPVRYESD